MPVTRKVYIGLAKAIRDSELSKLSKNLICKEIVKVLKEDNPLFDIEAFYAIARHGEDRK